MATRNFSEMHGILSDMTSEDVEILPDTPILTYKQRDHPDASSCQPCTDKMGKGMALTQRRGHST